MAVDRHSLLRIREYNWIAHRGEGPSRAGQVRTVFTLSYVECEVTGKVMLRVSLEKYIKPEELGPMQRKSHLKNYSKSLYVSGLCSLPE
jgi:hypothetical protein